MLYPIKHPRILETLWGVFYEEKSRSLRPHGLVTFNWMHFCDFIFLFCLLAINPMRFNRFKITGWLAIASLASFIATIVALTVFCYIRIKGVYDDPTYQMIYVSRAGWSSNRTRIYENLPIEAYSALQENRIQGPLNPIEMSSLLSGCNHKHYNYLYFELGSEAAMQLSIKTDGTIEYIFKEDKNTLENSFRCYFDGKIVYVADMSDLDHPLKIDYETTKTISPWSDKILSTFK